MMRRGKDERYSVVCRHCGKGFKAITQSHLRYVHGYSGEHPILEYKRRFGVRRAHSGETLAKIRKPSRQRHKAWVAKWPRRRILAAIRKESRQVQAGEPYRRDAELVRAARKRFGSWRAAVRQAGLKYTQLTGRIDWTPAAVLKAIQRLARLRRQRGTQVPARLMDAARRSFGTWEAAVKAAGIDYDQFTKRVLWTPERVLAAIRQRAKPQRQGMHQGRVPNGLYTAARRHFGSYRAAAQEAGVDFEQLAGKRQWSRKLVVAEIRELARRRRREPTGQPAVLRQAALRHFGSWSAAIRAAGLDPVEFRRLRWVREGGKG